MSLECGLHSGPQNLFSGGPWIGVLPAPGLTVLREAGREPFLAPSDPGTTLVKISLGFPPKVVFIVVIALSFGLFTSLNK